MRPPAASKHILGYHPAEADDHIVLICADDSWTEKGKTEKSRAPSERTGGKLVSLDPVRRSDLKLGAKEVNFMP